MSGSLSYALLFRAILAEIAKIQEARQKAEEAVAKTQGDIDNTNNLINEERNKKANLTAEVLLLLFAS
jgi:hypothetical protein